MCNLNLSYQDTNEMPWEYLDWFYSRHVQHLVDKQKAIDELNNKFN